MSGRDETFTIEHTLPRQRFDAFLRDRLPAVSRGAIQRLIEQGHILVDGHVVKPTHSPRLGEVVTIHWPEPVAALALPQEMPLDILFEDEALIVLNKAAGMVVHPAVGNEAGTLVNALLHHCRGQLSGIGGVERPGIVHRLDKDTSGCLVVAKNDESHVRLSEQFAGRDVRKFYETIVCGALPRDKGEIRASIGRHPSHRKRMAAVEGGREAWTSYRVLQRLTAATHVIAELHTGRTHQIRVHFQHVGFPVLGDEIYGKRQTARVTEQTGYAPPRQLLHARILEFTHPATRKEVRFEAPLPTDFLDAMRRLAAVG